MRIYQDTAIAVLDGYDILYSRQKATAASVQGVSVDF
jgi:hypothetical protein